MPKFYAIHLKKYLEVFKTRSRAFFCKKKSIHLCLRGIELRDKSFFIRKDDLRLSGVRKQDSPKKIPLVEKQ